jgi:hypothetical protein
MTAVSCAKVVVWSGRSAQPRKEVLHHVGKLDEHVARQRHFCPSFAAQMPLDFGHHSVPHFLIDRTEPAYEFHEGIKDPSDRMNRRNSMLSSMMRGRSSLCIGAASSGATREHRTGSAGHPRAARRRGHCDRCRPPVRSAGVGRRRRPGGARGGEVDLAGGRIARLGQGLTAQQGNILSSRRAPSSARPHGAAPAGFAVSGPSETRRRVPRGGRLRAMICRAIV